jgi:hypothetical protein
VNRGDRRKGGPIAPNPENSLSQEGMHEFSGFRAFARRKKSFYFIQEAFKVS